MAASSKTGCPSPDPTSIEVIDLAPWFTGNGQDRLQLSRSIGEACHRKGFFYIVNHGISESGCEQFMNMLSGFFKLPVEEKQRIHKIHSPQFRGWENTGSELTGNRIDYREQLDIGPERAALPHPDPYYLALVGPNQWPQESLIPGFRQVVTAFISQLTALSRELLGSMSLALGLEQHHIENVFGSSPGPYTKLIRYPPTTPGEQGVGVHKDSGFLTLLLQDRHRGLEARDSLGHWYAIDPLPGSFVVNVGELMQMMSRNYFIAAPHRVINDSPDTRHSAALFYSPDLDMPLDPLPVKAELVQQVNASDAHRNAGLMASRAEMSAGTGEMESRAIPPVFGEKYWQRWVRSYPDIAMAHYPSLVEEHP